MEIYNHKKRDVGLSIAYRRHIKKLNRKYKFYNINKVPNTTIPFIKSTIRAPAEISIYEVEEEKKGYSETIKFVKEIENNFSKNTCVIDFSNTHTFTAAASLIVYSALERSLKNGSKKSAILLSKIASNVNNLIKITKIDSLVKSRVIAIPKKGTKYLPIVSSKSDNYAELIIDHILQNVYGGKHTPDQEWTVSKAVKETINNVGLHAYPNCAKENKQWWLVCQALEGKVFLAIYDYGVGMPETVTTRRWFSNSFKIQFPELYREMIRDFPTHHIPILSKLPVFDKVTDEQLIFLSMTGDVSGTSKDKHGQGSKSIKGLVEETKGGKLWVFSNNGLYTLERAIEQGMESKPEPKLFSLPKKLDGTLVQWNIQIL